MKSKQKQLTHTVLTVMGFMLLLIGAPVPQSQAETCEAVGGAKCYYVSPTGSDTFPGTFAQPLFRPQEALRLVRPGDFVYLRGGTYTRDHSYTYARVWDDPTRGVYYIFINLGLVNMPEWASVTGTAQNWAVASGAPGNPITVKSYPGERVHVQNAGHIRIGSLAREHAYYNLEGITLEGDNILISGGSKGPNDTAINQVHDIGIRNNEVFNYGANSVHNIGLIKVDRGDWGGPYNITIENNILHDLYHTCTAASASCYQPGTLYWNDPAIDVQHFGAVTTLDCTSYVSPSCIGNGLLTIRNNVIYNVPQAFFFKNPAKGPIIISGNVFYNARGLGRGNFSWAASNIEFTRNIVRDISQGAGLGGDTSVPIYLTAGRNLNMQYNTFVGIDSVADFHVFGSNHTVKNNVIFGLRGRKTGATYDTPAYIGRSCGSVYCDNPDINLSELHTGNDFNDNCFITPSSDFLAVRREYRLPTGVTKIDHLDLAQAKQIFGFETRSIAIVETNKSNVFIDPANGDYRLKPNHACAAMGAYSSTLPPNPTAPPPPPPPSPEPTAPPPPPPAVAPVPPASNRLPSVPNLLFPRDGETALPRTIVFRWSAVTDPDGDLLTYTFCRRAGDRQFTDADCTPITKTALLARGIMYAGMGGSWGLGALLIGIVIMGWPNRRKMKGLGIALLLITGLSLSGCGNNISVSAVPAPEISNTVSGLSPNTTYFWKVIVSDGKGGTAESEVRSFTTANE